MRTGPRVPAGGFPAKEIVDGGFLELVRYGIRKADDPLIVDSLRVLDAVLKVDTPDGPCWRRYNHDGYGQREDGGPFVGYGKGRAWPLLTGERGHYELAAGRPPGPYLRAMEGFASPTGLLPEQVWDEPDRPDLFMFLGRPTGSARPLMWAHAEYIKLLRSAADGKVFDLVPEVADRYLSGEQASASRWKSGSITARSPRSGRGSSFASRRGRRFSSVGRGTTGARWKIRAPPRPRWGSNTSISITRPPQGGRIRFTFFWIDAGTWEGRDFEVAVRGS